MTDSTTGDKSSDGSFDAGPSAEELFGDIEGESPDGDALDPSRSDDGGPTDRARDGFEAGPAIEDRTATDVFAELREETSTDDGTDDLLADESPEDIIASADEGTEPAADAADELVVDEGALEDLLLTGRTKGEEFLWVDAGDSGSFDGTSGRNRDAGPESTHVETRPESPPEPAGGSQSGGNAALAEDDRADSPAGRPDETAPTHDVPNADESGDKAVAAAVTGTSEGASDTAEPSPDEPAREPGEESDSRSLVVAEESERSEEESAGILGWIRSKLPF